MNLGPIKDKTGNGILKKRTVKKICTAVAVCAVAVVAVTAAVRLTQKDEDIPTIQLPAPTDAVNSNGNVTVEKPAPTATLKPQPTPNTDQPASAGATVSQKMLLPVTESNVLKGYASDNLLYSNTLKHWCTHNAVDLVAPEGATVLSVLDGTVKSVTNDALMGMTVTVTHDNGVETVYSSLDTVDEGLKEGSSVLRGQAIGTVGATAVSEAADGAHLHFEVLKNGVHQNPQNYLSDFIK